MYVQFNILPQYLKFSFSKDIGMGRVYSSIHTHTTPHHRKISEVILYIISISLHCLNSLFETKSGLYGKKWSFRSNNVAYLLLLLFEGFWKFFNYFFEIALPHCVLLLLLLYICVLCPVKYKREFVKWTFMLTLVSK